MHFMVGKNNPFFELKTSQKSVLLLIIDTTVYSEKNQIKDLQLMVHSHQEIQQIKRPGLIAEPSIYNMLLLFNSIPGLFPDSGMKHRENHPIWANNCIWL